MMEVIKDYKLYLENAKTEFLKKYPKKGGRNNRSLHEFERVRTIGQGGFGKVFLVKDEVNEEYYAAKVIQKKRTVAKNLVERVLSEKRVLQAIDNPFLVNMVYFFKDNSYLYFILPYINGGNLFSLLTRKNEFEEIMAKFYVGQVVLGLEYLHYMNIAYRDLKPENLLLDEYGYLKITDMGFCKIVEGRTYTFCGTPDYLAPEILLNKGHSMAVDWWGLGVLIYDLIAGSAPFYDKDISITFQKITEVNYTFPPNFSYDVKDLIYNLLQMDLSRRYGNLRAGVRDIKDHPWFRQLDWMALVNKQINPPYVPKVMGPGDASNFHSVREIPLHAATKKFYVQEFKDF